MMQSDQSDWTPGTQQSGSGSKGGLKREADATKSALNEASGAVRERATGLASDAKKVASERAEAAQQTLGSYLDNFVGALNAAGDHLKQSDQSQIAGLVDTAAGSVDNFARAVKEKPLSEVVDQLRTFGRSNPTVLLAGSVLAGLAAARFLKSSAPSASSTSSYPPPTPYGATSSSGDDFVGSGSVSSSGGSGSNSSFGSGTGSASSSFGSTAGAKSGLAGSTGSSVGSSTPSSSTTGSSLSSSTPSSSSTGSSFPSALSDAAGDRSARDTVESSSSTSSMPKSGSSLPPLAGTPDVRPTNNDPAAGDRRK